MLSNPADVIQNVVYIGVPETHQVADPFCRTFVFKYERYRNTLLIEINGGEQWQIWYNFSLNSVEIETDEDKSEKIVFTTRNCPSALDTRGIAEVYSPLSPRTNSILCDHFYVQFASGGGSLRGG